MRIDFDDEIIWLDKVQHISYENICRCIHVRNDDIVYLGGSLIEGYINPLSSGMGNRFSDIDVFIIREHDAFQQTECVYDDGVRRTFFCDGKPVGLDVEVYDKSFVTALEEALKMIRVNPDDKINNVFSKYLSHECTFELINTFLCRLYNSICIKGQECYELIRGEILYKKFFNLYICKLITEIDGLIDDIRGNIEEKQIDVALYCARNMYLQVLFIILMSNDVFLDRRKWLILKFRNMIKTRPMYKCLWKYYVDIFKGDLTNQKECERNIRNILLIVERELEHILIGDDLLL